MLPLLTLLRLQFPVRSAHEWRRRRRLCS